MPGTLRKQYPGAKYHNTARGVGGKSIFAHDADRERFLSQLEYALELEELSLPGRRVGLAKWVVVEFACRLCGLTQRAAGERYGGITCAAAGKLRRKLAGELREDSALRRRIDRLEDTLNPRRRKV